MSETKADLLQGTLDMLILKALSLGPLHGYGIIQRIHQVSGALLTVEQGSLYPALYRIEQRGWVTSKWGTADSGRRAKLYTLTRAGRKQLAVEEESWDRLALAVIRVRQAT
jgi:transcriptional regulator